MIEYKGEYGTAKVMIDVLDDMTISQIFTFVNNEVFTNPIAIMPDTHAGKGSVIGFTMEMTDKIIPNVVGVDINCGVYSVRFKESILKSLTKKDIDEKVREVIPFGNAFLL